MAATHHIWFSRTLAGIAFAMFLVLTPKAWIDSSSNAAEEVPVQTLEPDTDCLFCQQPASAPRPSTSPCTDDSNAQNNRLWLNPDEVVTPLDLAPCVERLVGEEDHAS